jgi:hypothetical protein
MNVDARGEVDAALLDRRGPCAHTGESWSAMPVVRLVLVVTLAMVGCSAPRRAAPTANASTSEPAAKPQGKTRVLVVTAATSFLEGALLVYDDVETRALAPREYERDPELAASADVVFFDGYTPIELPPPPTDVVFFGPTGSDSPVPIADDISDASVTVVDEDHPVLRYVALSEVRIDAGSVFAADEARDETTLASSSGRPVIVTKREGGRNILAIGFSTASSDFALRLGFPILVRNTLDWFAVN